MLCGVLFRALIKEGRLTVIDAGGKRHVFGEDRSPASGIEPARGAPHTTNKEKIGANIMVNTCD